MRNIKADRLSEEHHPHPLVEPVIHCFTRLIIIRTNSRLNLMTPGVGEGEGGVGPTVGIEYSSRYTLRDERITENIVCINCLEITPRII